MLVGTDVVEALVVRQSMVQREELGFRPDLRRQLDVLQQFFGRHRIAVDVQHRLNDVAQPNVDVGEQPLQVPFVVEMDEVQGVRLGQVGRDPALHDGPVTRDDLIR